MTSTRPVGPLDVVGLGSLLVGLAILAHVLAGCGASAISQHTQAATIAAITLGAAGDVADEARDRSLDAVEIAHPIHGEERTAALDTEAARWRPLGQALDAAREALLTWGAAIQAAHAIGEQGTAALLPQIVAIAAHVVLLYERIAALARELGAEVPVLPDVVVALVRAIGGA